MAANRNIFDETFDRVSENRLLAEDIRARLIESVLELSEVKRIYHARQKELAEREVEASKYEIANQELKIILMKSLIEKQELETRKESLISSIDQLNQQINHLEQDASLGLCSERVQNFCERNSTTNQLSLLQKIVEAKSKLMEFGFPPCDPK